MLDIARREEIEELFSRPSPPVLSHILKVLIFDGIHYEFDLGAAYPIELSDKQIDEKIQTLLNINQCTSPCTCESPRNCTQK